MASNQKIRVAVLYGGRSAEHEVSLQTAKNIIEQIDRTQFEVIPVGISQEGHWFLGDAVFEQSLLQNHVPEQPCLTWFTPAWVNEPNPTQTVAPASHPQMQPSFDVIFPAVHGTFCEDGTLQGLLELANLPYVGCSVLASAVGMDKVISKQLALQNGIKTGEYLSLRKQSWLNQSSAMIDKIVNDLGFPVFVKPANTGSSIGVTKAKNKESLCESIQLAFQYDNKVIVEKALHIRELEIAVLQSLDENADPIVSVVGEIIPSHEFYSYDAKYMDPNGAQLSIPANIPEEIAIKAKQMAKDIFRVLDCEGMARVDLFYDLDSNDVLFNEINTLPGFTQISMYPKLMAHTGMKYADLLTHLLKLAIQRFDHNKKLRRSYLIA